MFISLRLVQSKHTEMHRKETEHLVFGLFSLSLHTEVSSDPHEKKIQLTTVYNLCTQIFSIFICYHYLFLCSADNNLLHTQRGYASKKFTFEDFKACISIRKEL